MTRWPLLTKYSKVTNRYSIRRSFHGPGGFIRIHSFSDGPALRVEQDKVKKCLTCRWAQNANRMLWLLLIVDMNIHCWHDTRIPVHPNAGLYYLWVTDLWPLITFQINLDLWWWPHNVSKIEELDPAREETLISSLCRQCLPDPEFPRTR